MIETRNSKNISVRHLITPIKAINKTIDGVEIKTNISEAGKRVSCQLLDENLNVLLTANKTPENTGIQFIEFDFPESMVLDFASYISVYAATNTILISSISSSARSDLVDYSRNFYGILKTSANQNNPYLNASKNMCHFNLTLKSHILPNAIIYDRQIERKIVEKTELTDYTAPPFIYTTLNDINRSRQYHADLYLDHMFNVNAIDKGMYFGSSGLDFISLKSQIGQNPHSKITNEQSESKVELEIVDSLETEDKTGKIDFKLRSAKASNGNSKKSFVLCIGDSQTMNGGTGSANGERVAYWGYAAQLFEMDKIDNGLSQEVVFLGSERFSSWESISKFDISFDYQGETQMVHASAEGVGSWSLTHHMRMATSYSISDDLVGIF